MCGVSLLGFQRRVTQVHEDDEPGRLRPALCRSQARAGPPTLAAQLGIYDQVTCEVIFHRTPRSASMPRAAGGLHTVRLQSGAAEPVMNVKSPCKAPAWMDAGAGSGKARLHLRSVRLWVHTAARTARALARPPLHPALSPSGARTPQPAWWSCDPRSHRHGPQRPRRALPPGRPDLLAVRPRRAS